MTIGICSIFLEQSKGLESLDDMNIYNDELYVLGIGIARDFIVIYRFLVPDL